MGEFVENLVRLGQVMSGLGPFHPWYFSLTYWNSYIYHVYIQILVTIFALTIFEVISPSYLTWLFHRQWQKIDKDKSAYFVNRFRDLLPSSSVMVPRILLMAAFRLDLFLSMWSSLTRTVSILDTIDPIDFSMRSTRWVNLKNVISIVFRTNFQFFINHYVHVGCFVVTQLRFNREFLRS